LICYDDTRPEELEKAKEANEELLRRVHPLGGSVTGDARMGLDQGQEPFRCSTPTPI